ncbi:mycothiol conjugate amidase Mca [Corynebacterium sp. TAE3-ERU12]|uniref:mycothiol conjugate amidase Mca n=1 Tax=Corynebacterium sp. TAE3-ERU12 TaxID=2849491 RepID=UPI001C43F277|nr:mycothiol conjugate amidase Mca [Corynebacterium sp. TAE3-ERU12]MBV7295702.1 mycothiol conjugate amidase Mca [Corynebacterium sp. TAE3-ERU12]
MAKRLMAVHAHPDDEASKGAATMARYAREGVEVMVVTCTGGERGSILNPAMDLPEVRDNMHEVRVGEMAESARILGVQHKWLGFVDSGLPQGMPTPVLPDGCFARERIDTAVRPLVKAIREFRPHVLITYDENGGYPHPDHIMTHIISMRAWNEAAAGAPELGAPWQIQKMYYTHGFIRKRLELLDADYKERGEESPLAPALARWRGGGDLMRRVTTQVPCSEYFHLRDEALIAHATQIDPKGPFFAVPLDVQRRVWPTEEFELARTRVRTKLPENDLFAGVIPDAEWTAEVSSAAEGK